MELLRNTFREADLRRYEDEREAAINDQILNKNLTSIEDARTNIEEAIDELDGLIDQDLLNEMGGAIGEINRLVYEIRRDSGI